MWTFFSPSSRERQHLSEEQMLLFLDGEVSSREASKLRRHVEGCWECRAQLAATEDTICDFVQLHHKQFGGALPAAEGPAALLRAQIRKCATNPRNTVSKNGIRNGILPRTLWVSAMALVVLAGPLFIARFAQKERAYRNQIDWERVEPRAALTPGEVVTISRTKVCASSGSMAPPRVPRELAETVFRLYGLSTTRQDDFELDYLITPDLGGAQTVRNLWPEPYYHTPWNAHVKDRLESRLRNLVCDGQMELVSAQREISSHWIRSYKRRFRTERPAFERSLVEPLFAQLQRPEW